MDENMQIYYNVTSENCIKQFFTSLNFYNFIWYLKCLFSVQEWQTINVVNTYFGQSTSLEATTIII